MCAGYLICMIVDKNTCFCKQVCMFVCSYVFTPPPQYGLRLNSMLLAAPTHTVGDGGGTSNEYGYVPCDPRQQDADLAETTLTTERFDSMLSELPVAYQRPHLKVCD